MPDIDTTDLRAGADNIHSIGPARAAGLLIAAAETIDKLQYDLAMWRKRCERYQGFSACAGAADHPPHPDVIAEHIRAHGGDPEQATVAQIADAMNATDPNFTYKPNAAGDGLDATPVSHAGAGGSIRIVGGSEAIAALGLSEERGCPPGSCAASPRCRNRAEMRANHGTPEQFIAAISRAAGEMTVAEADRAVARYCDAWEAATEPAAVVCTACEGEQFEGAICDACGDHVELAPNGDGTFTRVYHSPEQIRGFVRADAEIIGAPSLAIAEQFDAEARLAAEDPGTPGDGLADIDSAELTIPPMPVQLAEHRRRQT